MFHSLLSEPQVSITQNLAPQLTDGGLFIPEEVNIEAGITSFAEEPFLSDTTKPLPSTTEPTALAKLFSLNKNTAQSPLFSNLQYLSPSFKLPAFQKSKPDICLLTKVKIFETFNLDLSESLITNPYCLVSMLNLPPEANIRFVYKFASLPSWSYQLAD